MTLEGLRQQVGGATIIALLEPRSNTMKRGVHINKLASALDAADRVMLYASPDLLWDAEDALQPLGTRAQVFTDTQMIVEQVLLTAKPGDYVLVMSNGGFENIHQRLLDALAMSNMFTLSSHTTTHSM